MNTENQDAAIEAAIEKEFFEYMTTPGPNGLKLAFAWAYRKGYEAANRWVKVADGLPTEAGYCWVQPIFKNERYIDHFDPADQDQYRPNHISRYQKINIRSHTQENNRKRLLCGNCGHPADAMKRNRHDGCVDRSHGLAGHAPCSR